jgi:hypothetical protein
MDKPTLQGIKDAALKATGSPISDELAQEILKEAEDAYASAMSEPAPEPEKPDPPDIFDNFDTDLFKRPPSPEAAKKFLNTARYRFSSYIRDNLMSKEEREVAYAGVGACPYSPRACHKAGTSQCNKKCEQNPDYFMDPKIRKVYDEEPWSNYCFTCGEFVPSRNHEGALDPPEQAYSHIVATGYHEYKVKIREATLERLTGKHHETQPPPDWKNSI